jgi:hypothetical protein
MFDISSAVSLRAAPPVTLAVRPPVGPFLPPSLAAANRFGEARSFTDQGSPRAGMSYDGRSMEGLQRAIQAVGPSLMESLARGDGASAQPGNRSWGGMGAARPSTLERVYTWGGTALRQFLGGPAQAELPASRTRRDVGPAKLARNESAGAPAPRVRRGVEEDFLAQFGDARPAKAPSGVGNLFPDWWGNESPSKPADASQPPGTTEKVPVPKLTTARPGEPGLGDPARSRPPARGSEPDVGRAQPGRKESASPAKESPLPLGFEEAFLKEFGDPYRRENRYINWGDRSDFPHDRNVPESLFPIVNKTVSLSISRRAVGMTGGAQRKIDGTAGVLTRVRLALPPNAAKLTVKATREGDGPTSESWSPSCGIGGISATIVSDNPKESEQNILNLRPLEPHTARLGGLDSGRSRPC